jgi:predicted GNAT family acetyltransferase
MSTTEPAPRVRDVPEEGRFLYEEDGMEAELVYRAVGKRLVLVHTGVPEKLGGRGLGGNLVRAAVERAGREHLTLVPWCPYTRKWLQDHPAEVEGIGIDWDTPAPDDQ